VLPLIDLGSRAVRIAENLNGISDVVQLSNGVIVFGEVYEDRLVYLTTDPPSVRYVGREGRGPGEFLRIDGVVKLRSDTVAVLDAISRRLSLFDIHGDFVRAIPLLAPPQGALWLDCTFYSDSLGNVYAVPTSGRNRHELPYTLDTLPVLRFTTDGISSAPIWTVEVRAHQLFPMTSGHVIARMPFTAPVVVGVAEDGTLFATTWDGEQLIRRSTDGLVTLGPPFELPERDVTRAVRDSFTEWFTSRATYSGTRLEFPAKRAAFDQGEVSPQGETWLRATESVRGRTTYLLVDSTGRVQAKILVSIGSRIVGFGTRALFLVTPSSEGGSDLHVLPRVGIPSPPAALMPPLGDSP
jgi:hypothetical protein